MEGIESILLVGFNAIIKGQQAVEKEVLYIRRDNERSVLSDAIDI